MSLSTTFTEEQGGEVLRVSLDGSLDGTTAPKLDADLSARIRSGLSLLVLDMKRLSYISSAGLRVVFKTAKALRAVGGAVALANRQPHIIRSADGQVQTAGRTKSTEPTNVRESTVTQGS